MRKIVYSTADGGVVVVIPVISSDDVDMTDEMAEQRMLSRIPADAINVQLLDELPDRTYRDAWVAGNGTIEYDKEKVKEIKLIPPPKGLKKK